jgi:hypothetical protein
VCLRSGPDRWPRRSGPRQNAVDWTLETLRTAFVSHKTQIRATLLGQELRHTSRTARRAWTPSSPSRSGPITSAPQRADSFSATALSGAILTGPAHFAPLCEVAHSGVRLRRAAVRSPVRAGLLRVASLLELTSLGSLCLPSEIRREVARPAENQATPGFPSFHAETGREVEGPLSRFSAAGAASRSRFAKLLRAVLLRVPPL